MSEDSEPDVLAGELRETLSSMQKSLTWIRALTREAKDLRISLKQLETTHGFLQQEYQKSEHNLKISESMVAQLSIHIKKTSSTQELYEALSTPIDDQVDARTVDLCKEIGELKDIIIYQNAEIQRLLERYERDTIPPGLRFKTGIDIKFEHDNLPGGSLIQGGLKVGSSINNL